MLTLSGKTAQACRGNALLPASCLFLGSCLVSALAGGVAGFITFTLLAGALAVSRQLAEQSGQPRDCAAAGA